MQRLGQFLKLNLEWCTKAHPSAHLPTFHMSLLPVSEAATFLLTKANMIYAWHTNIRSAIDKCSALRIRPVRPCVCVWVCKSVYYVYAVCDIYKCQNGCDSA